jgi:hypothetical protein
VVSADPWSDAQALGIFELDPELERS